MKKVFFRRFAIMIVIGMVLLSTVMPCQARISGSRLLTVAAVGETEGVSPGDILYQEDFEDKDLTAADPNLVNGLTWISSGPLACDTFSGGIRLRMNAGASVLSNQTISQSEYTVCFIILNYYNTAGVVSVAYQDENNFYSFAPASGKLYRTLDGVEEELTQTNVSRVLISPREKPSVNNYKIHFLNDGSAITIAVDRDGYQNGKDYDFTFIDQNAIAVNRFTSGKIKLARVDAGTSRYWVNYDNILVVKGKLQAVQPRSPGQLYVCQATGDDSYDGTQTKPFKTITQAIASSLPGDEIVVEEGAYGEQIKFLSNRIYAEEGKRLTLRSRNKHKATVCGATLKYGDFVVMDGFEVIEKGIQVAGSTGAEVLNNYIHDVGLGIQASGINGRVAGNYLSSISMGITVSGTNMLVENNELERLIWKSGDSDYFRFFGEGHIIRGNYMHGTRQEEIGKAHVDGFQTFDNNGEFARNIIIDGNFIEDFYHQGFMGEGAYHYHSYNIIFRNNVFKDAAAWGLCISKLKDVKVYNNIFINMKTHGVGFRGTEEMPATGEVRNNIFYNGRNCYFGLDSNQMSGSNNLLFYSDEHKKYSQEKFPNDIVNVDPLFIDIDNDDYSLHPNSPAIDAGISLDFDRDYVGNSRLVGNGWDIGPFEHQGSSLPVACIQYSNVSSRPSGYEPFKVTLDGSNSYAPAGKSIVSYHWDFGDGTTGSGTVVNHSFMAGKHTVQLTVTDTSGNKHTASQIFDILPSEFPNLNLYLPFDAGCLDVSGKNMTVNASDSIILEDSLYGKAIRLNNDASRGISVKHSDYLDGLDEITIAFLAKKDNKTAATTFVNKHTVYRLSLTKTGISASIAGSSCSAANVVDDTNWHHYAITYDGSHIVVYIDGIERSRTECTGKIKRDSSREIVIGRDPWGDSLEGLMDEFRIYDRCLSEEEIKQIMVPDSRNPTPSPTQTQKQSPAPTQSPSPTPVQGASPTPEQGQSSSPTASPGQNQQTPGGDATPTNSPNQNQQNPGGSSVLPTPTMKPPSTPSPTKPPEPTSTRKAGEASDQKNSLITSDYAEMVRLLELLCKSADIRDNSLNPTYGAMMKRKQVTSLATRYQSQLKELAKLTFSDVRGDEWYASHIPLSVYRMLIRGFPDGTFKGANLVSRAEVLTMLARFNNSEDSIKQSAQNDAESWIRLAEQIGNDWYTQYIVVVKDSLVHPDQYTRETLLKPMTRGEVFYALAAFLWNEDIQEGGKYHTMAVLNKKPAFSDTLKTIHLSHSPADARLKSWYRQLTDADPANGVPMDFYPSIICLKEKGILLGNNGESKWHDPISRAEVLALFERLAKVWGEESSE